MGWGVWAEGMTALLLIEDIQIPSKQGKTN
jgi:hypothetical protein